MPTRRDPRAPVKTDNPSLHERMVRELVDSDPAICRNGFWETVKLLAEELGEEGCPTRKKYNFLPDAYKIDREDCSIIIYEVEVTCHMKPYKLEGYGYFWEWWDGSGEHDWLPRLIVVDRYGHQNELSMFEMSYARHSPKLDERSKLQPAA